MTFPWADRMLESDDDREAWLLTRRSFFTGSDAAALVGEHEYTTLQAVIAEKLTGKSDFNAHQDHIMQGSHGEDFVAGYTSAAFGVDLAKVGRVTVHRTVQELAATPDYYAVEGGALGAPGPCNVQIKFTTAKGFCPGKPGVLATRLPLDQKRCMQWGPHIPRYIWWQVQQEMAVMELDQTIVLAYHRRAIPRFGAMPGSQLGMYLVKRDAAAIGRLEESAIANKKGLLPR